MNVKMLGARYKPEIFCLVIFDVFVQMVNKLVRIQATTKLTLHNNAMLMSPAFLDVALAAIGCYCSSGISFGSIP